FEAEHRATERQAFLAEASRVLSSSLDYDATLARVARLAVPELADACGIHVNDGNDLRLAAVAHAQPELEAILLAISGRDQHVARDALLLRVARTGEPVITPDVPPDVWDQVAEDAEHRRLLRALDIRSGMIVPLVARGRTVGVMSLQLTTSGRHYKQSDLTVVEDLASR